MPIVLIITTKDQEPFEFPVLEKSTLGRSSSCDICINDGRLSGKHGYFEPSNDGKLIYCDIGSTNGSFLNNNQVQKINFRIYETLLVGSTIITINEKKLNFREQMAIGSAEKADIDKTIAFPVEPSSLKPPSENKNEKNIHEKPNLLGINNKLQKADIFISKKEKIIEREISSGKTKMLKLSEKKKKK